MNQVMHDTRLPNESFLKNHIGLKINPQPTSGEKMRSSGRLGLFDSFADMIQQVSDGSIMAVIDRECFMLSRDLLWNAPWSKDDVGSILLFGEFIRHVKKSVVISGFFLIPENQYEVYQNLILKLIQARELKPDALRQFNNCFYPRKASGLLK